MNSTDRPHKSGIEPGGRRKVKGARLGEGFVGDERKPRPTREAPRVAGPPKARLDRSREDAGLAPARSRDLPLPDAAPSDEPATRSLALRLLVEGSRITVLGADEVAAPPSLVPERGTDFVVVRRGDAVVALTPVVDAGLAVGIPPHDDPDRGHRVVEASSYLVTTRAPLDALDDVEPLSVALLHADEHTELRPDATALVANRLAVRAESGPLRVGDLRAARGTRKEPGGQPPVG